MLAQRVATAPVVRTVEPPVHIGVYDGPLDLLLFLVKREGVDIRDIPCARICDAYLSYLDDVDEIDVDLAGEYLVMAATLCQLKARELLPRAAEAAAEEEEEDPKDALARRLLEYERYRAAAEELGERTRLDRDVFTRPATPPAPDEQPIDPTTDGWGLARMFYDLVRRRAAPPPVHRVEREHYTFAERVRWVLGRLDDAEEHTLSEIFVDVPGKAERIVTLLAVLEMAKLQMLDVWQRIHLGAVSLVGRVRLGEADLSALPEDI
jgi:segregation and condensation protein A